MTLEWIDPPMNHNDMAQEAAKELRTRPGDWARLAHDITDADSDKWEYALRALPVQRRHVRVDSRWRARFLPEFRRFDVYARARKEA